MKMIAQIVMIFLSLHLPVTRVASSFLNEEHRYVYQIGRMCRQVADPQANGARRGLAFSSARGGNADRHLNKEAAAG